VPLWSYSWTDDIGLRSPLGYISVEGRKTAEGRKTVEGMTKFILILK
jgi:hypothetical protein